MLGTKLTGMAESLHQQETDPSYQEMNFQERMGLQDWEFSRRQHTRLQRLIHSAQFQDSTACVESICYEDDRKLDRRAHLGTGFPATISHMPEILSS